MQRAFTYRLLAELSQSLESEGYPIGTGQYLRIQELLSQLPEETPAEELKHMLSPLFARSAQQQEQFYRLFDQSLRRTQRYFGSLEETPVGAAATAIKEDAKTRWLRALVIFLVVALFVPPLILFGLRYWEENSTPLLRPFTVQGGEKVEVCIADSIIGEHIGQMENFEVRYGGKDGYGTFLVNPPGCLTYIAQDSISGRDSLLIAFDGPAGELQVNFIPIVQQITPSVDDSTKVDTTDSPEVLPEEQDTTAAPELASWTARSLPYQHDLFAYGVDPPSWLQQQLARYKNWLKLGGFILGYGLLLALLLYRFRRRQAAQVHPGNDKPPYAWHIRMEGVEDIELSPTFLRLLNRMRTRTRSELYELDLPGTIDATIEKGGMVDFKYRRQTRPPEYLMLIDQQSRRNHRSQLFNHIFRKFRTNEVLIERFYYDGDPRLCYNEQYPEGISLTALQQRYGQARLFIIGSGHAFIHKMTGKLVDWAEVLKGWKERALFTPKAVVKWGRRERRLGQLFHLLPLQLESLEILLEAYEVDETPTAESWQQRLAPLLSPPIELQGSLMTTLQQHYSPIMMRWIAACAVLPALHWHLTLYWGRYLSSGEDRLLTLERIQQLCRLPWFVQGEMPDYVRVQLTAWLEQQHPELLRDIRQELIHVLGEHAPPADSSAYEDYRMQAALNEYLTVSNSARKQQLAEEVSQLMDMGNDIDLVVEQQLDQQRQGVAAWLPESWQQRLYRQGMPALGFENLWSELRWFVPALLFVTGIMSMPWPLNLGCDGPMVEVKNQDQSAFLCLTDQKAWGLYLEAKTMQEVRANALAEAMPQVARTLALLQGESVYVFNRDYRVGDNLLQWYLPQNGESLQREWGQLNVIDDRFSLTLRPFPDSTGLAAEIRTNLAVTLYNQGVRLALEAESTDADSALHAQACAYFGAALQIDTVFLRSGQRVRDWCAGEPGMEASCQVVTRQTVLRTQPIDDGKAAAISADYTANEADVELDSDWYLKTLYPNQIVQVFGESPYAYQVVANGIPGYLPKLLGEDSVLQACEEQFYILTGRVADASGAKGISDVEVKLDTFTAKTNGEGQFRLDIPRVGRAATDSLHFAREGYDTISRAVDLSAARPIEVRMTLNEDPAKRFLTLKASIENLSTGEQIAEALVQTPSGKAFQGHSDKNGEVEVLVPYLGALGSRGLSVKVSKSGFKPREYFVPLQDLRAGKLQSFVLKPVADEPDEQPVTDTDGTKEKYNSRYLWCLDNPHGGSSAGNRSPVFDDGKTQLTEAQLSRELVRRIKARLQRAGIAVFEVVPENKDISVRERINRINRQSSRQPKIVLSLHFSRATSSTATAPWAVEAARGVKALPQRNSSQSANLGGVLLESIIRQTGLRYRDFGYAAGQEAELLKQIDAIGVRIENGVLNNRVDAALLAQPAFLQKLAEAYANAILAVEQKALADIAAPLLSEDDSDEDGIDNPQDRCPFEPAVNSEDGCPAEGKPLGLFESRLSDIPATWSAQKDKAMKASYNKIYTYLPEEGVRGRYAVLKSALNPQILEQLIGEPVFLSGPHQNGTINFQGGERFGRYNPAFLRKLESYLRSASQNKWMFKQLKGFYDKEFRDLLRVFYDNHQVVQDRPRLTEGFNQLLQRKAKKSSSLYAINNFFLEELDNLRGRQDFLVQVMTIRFWVRRSVDGTADEFYDLLRLAMNTFDPDYTPKPKGKGIIDKK
jgi:N-acetylmuramoyl-L-alanine amidase